MRWRTAATSRTVLAIVHNVTAATRLLDVLAPLGCDLRVQLTFSCPGSSAFTHGTDAYLRKQGIAPIRWKDALSTDYDLAIAASAGGDLHRIAAPLVRIPHGMGYNKFLDPETRRPGDPETRRPGDPETRRPGDPETRVRVVPAVVGT